MEQKEQMVTALAPVQSTQPMCQPMIAIGGGVALTLGEAMSLAETLAGCATLPAHFKKPADVMVGILTAAELGLPLMAVLRSLKMIKENATLSADLMLAAVRAKGAVGRWEEQGDSTYCEVTASRADDGTTMTVRHDRDDAKRERMSGDNWTRFERAMHRAAVVRVICRALWPDVLAGCYDEHEMTEPSRPVAASPREVVNEATGEIVEQPAPARSDQRTVARVCAKYAEVQRCTNANDAAWQLSEAANECENALDAGLITPYGTGRTAVNLAENAAKRHYSMLLKRESVQPEQPAEQPVVEEGADIAAAQVVYKQMRTRIIATTELADPEDGLADLEVLRAEVKALADTPGWSVNGKALASLLKLCADVGRDLEQRRANADAAPSDLEG
jgi:hypothetical protein